MPDILGSKPENQTFMASGDLGLLVFPKVSQSSIQDLKTDTIYSKSVTNLRYFKDMILVNNMMATEDFDSDTLIHPAQDGLKF